MMANLTRTKRRLFTDGGPLPPGTLITLGSGVQLVIKAEHRDHVLEAVRVDTGEVYEKTLMELCLFGRATYQIPIAC